MIATGTPLLIATLAVAILCHLSQLGTLPDTFGDAGPAYETVDFDETDRDCNAVWYASFSSHIPG